MRPLSTAAQAELRKLHNPNAYAWLYKLTLNVTEEETLVLRVTSHDKEVTWNSKTWKPYPCGHDQIAGDSEGNLSTVSVWCSNIAQGINRWAEVDKGFSGRPFQFIWANKNALAVEDAETFSFTVAGCSVDRARVTLRLSPGDFYRHRVPREIYNRTNCRHAYKQDRCGYRGTIATCDKTYAGPNGCIVHGDDELATGAPRAHPLRFGGFPAIPRRIR
jgi:phage-related protein